MLASINLQQFISHHETIKTDLILSNVIENWSYFNDGDSCDFCQILLENVLKWMFCLWIFSSSFTQESTARYGFKFVKWFWLSTAGPFCTLTLVTAWIVQCLLVALQMYIPSSASRMGSNDSKPLCTLTRAWLMGKNGRDHRTIGPGLA